MHNNNPSAADPEAALAAARTADDRIAALLALSDTLGTTDVDRALACAEQALREAEQLPSALAAARSRLRIARRRNYRAEYRQALAQIDAALPALEELGTVGDQADACLAAGMACYYLAEFARAEHYAQRGLDLCRQHGDTARSGDFYNMLAALQTRTGDHRAALPLYRRAIDIAEQTGDLHQTALRLGNIANVYKALGEFTTALECCQRSYAIAVERDDKRLFINAALGLGRIYVDLGDYPRAIDYFLRSLDTCREIGFRLYLHGTHLNLSAVYALMEKYTEAMQHSLTALEIAREQEDRQGESHALQNLGLFYYEIGDMERALEFCMQALAVREAIGYRQAIAESVLSIGRVYMRLGSAEEALPYLRRSLDFYQTLEPDHVEQSKAHNSLPMLYLELANAALMLGEHDDGARYMRRYAELQEAADATRSGAATRAKVQAFEAELALRLARHYGIDLPVRTTTEALRAATRPQQTPAPPAAPVQITTFGRFAVVVRGRELTAADWKRKKARDLFKILLINHRRAVTTEELTDLLWSGDSPDNAQNILWNAISTIRLALEPGLGKKMPSSYIRSADRSYTLDLGDDAAIDVLQFRRLLAEAQHETDDERRNALLARAVALYTGDFLPEDATEEWASFERESLRELCITARLRLAGHAAAQRDVETAAAHATAVLALDRLHTEAWELLLHLYRDTGRDNDARELVQQCRLAFLEEAGIAPPVSLR